VAFNALFNLRNQLLSSARFRHLAQKIPFFQWVARRRARDLFRVCSGFIHSQVLLACVRLGLFDFLRDGAKSTAEIAGRASIPEDRARQLLRAAAALRLLEARRDDRFGIGVLGAAMIDNASLLALVEHHAMLYVDLENPVALFRDPGRETKMSQLWPYAAGQQPDTLETDDVASYTDLMAASQEMVAEQVIEAFSFRRQKRLLDIGGGAGAFAIAVAKRWPHLEITIADLPAVADIARRRVDAAGLASRIRVVGVDATKGSLPGGFDTVSLVRILHDHDEETVLELLTAARSAMAEAGTLLVAEPMADAPGAGDLNAAYFNVYLMAMGSGRPRRADELGALMESAGFRDVRPRRTPVPLITGVLVARH
jgi:demethylspheroidene O-methyltransferase